MNSNEDCLHLAIDNKLPQVVELLCQKGAVVDARDAAGESALWKALSTAQFDVASTLVS